MFIKTSPSPPHLDEALGAETLAFEDRLVCAFTLTPVTGGVPIVLSGHNIQRFSLDMKSTGFSGEIVFKVDDDQTLGGTIVDSLFPIFRTPQLLKLHLGIRAHKAEDDARGTSATAPPPMVTVDGLVTDKSVTERVARHVEGSPVLYRSYTVRFADPAQVLWRQHFPCALYTQTSFQSVIQQHLNPHIAVQFIDTTLAAIEPQIFLGLSVQNRADERASFYDLLMWRLDETERIWRYDYVTRQYQILKVKTPPVATDIVGDDLKEIFTYYPAPPRQQEFQLNDYTEQIQNRPLMPADPLLTQNGVRGVRQDFLHNTPILNQFEAELLRRTRRFRMPKPVFVLRYRYFPTLPYAPGVGVDFTADAIDFASEDVVVPPEAKAEPCRVTRVRMRCESLEDDVRPTYDGLGPGRFRCQLNTWLETASDPDARLPPYVLPAYPVCIEGKVLSEIGLPVEETYQFYPDPVTFLNRYKVYVPLFANQVVTVPFTPNQDPGHFYFPAYKNERVLIALFYDRAQFERYLDWRATAQLPLESQGDHLLLGKTPVNRTSLRHTYQNQLPVFEIERLHMTRSFDTELMKMSEGSLLLQVGTPLGAPPPGVPVMGGSAAPGQAPPGGPRPGGAPPTAAPATPASAPKPTPTPAKPGR